MESANGVPLNKQIWGYNRCITVCCDDKHLKSFIYRNAVKLWPQCRLFHPSPAPPKSPRLFWSLPERIGPSLSQSRLERPPPSTRYYCERLYTMLVNLNEDISTDGFFGLARHWWAAYRTEEDDRGKLSRLCQHGKVEEHKDTDQGEAVDTISDVNFQIKRRKGKKSNMSLALLLK